MAYTIPAGCKIIIHGGSIGGDVSGAGTICFESVDDDATTERVGINGETNIENLNVEIDDGLEFYRKNSLDTDAVKIKNANLDISNLDTDATLILDGTTAETTTTDDQINVESNGKFLANGTLNAALTTVSGASIGVYGDGSILYLNNTENEFSASTPVYQTAGTGYLSVNSSVENLSIVTDNDCRMIRKGAGVTSISATVTVQTASIQTTKTDATKQALIERKLGSDWVVVGYDSTSTNVADDEGRVVFRAWDGTNFTTAAPCQRTFYLIHESGGSFANVADWALDKNLTIVCTNAPTIAGNVFDCRNARP